MELSILQMRDVAMLQKNRLSKENQKEPAQPYSLATE